MGSDLDHNLAVLLTSCIDPGNVCSVARRDPAIRLNDYVRSLKFFLLLRSIGNIVFCENSGFDVSEIREVVRLNNPYQKKVEILSFYGQPDRPEYGKGYGEMRIIDYALEHSTIIRECSMIMKVTGRLIVANAEKIGKAIGETNGVEVFCDLRRDLTTADSRFFCATPRFVRKYFMSFAAIMDESTGICFEDVLARAVHRAMADGMRWSMLPYAHDIRGVAATADERIPCSRWRLISRELFRSLKSAVLSR